MLTETGNRARKVSGTQGTVKSEWMRSRVDLSPGGHLGIFWVGMCCPGPQIGTLGTRGFFSRAAGIFGVGRRPTHLRP